MVKPDFTDQSYAANIPLSNNAILSFQATWREVTGENIPSQKAAEHGRRLLALYKFVYGPITKEQYQQLLILLGKPPKENSDD